LAKIQPGFVGVPIYQSGDVKLAASGSRVRVDVAPLRTAATPTPNK